MPDTLNYLLLALGFSFGPLVAFVIALIARHRSLQKDMEIIERLREDDYKPKRKIKNDEVVGLGDDGELVLQDQ